VCNGFFLIKLFEFGSFRSKDVSAGKNRGHFPYFAKDLLLNDFKNMRGAKGSEKKFAN